MLFPDSKYTVPIKYWKDTWSEPTLGSTLLFINIHYVKHVNTDVTAYIIIITKYINLVFQLNGPLYAATIWIPSQCWSNYVITKCTPLLKKYVIPIGRIQPISLTQKTWRLNLSSVLCNQLKKLSNTIRIDKITIPHSGYYIWLNTFTHQMPGSKFQPITT